VSIVSVCNSSINNSRFFCDWWDERKVVVVVVVVVVAVVVVVVVVVHPFTPQRGIGPYERKCSNVKKIGIGGCGKYFAQFNYKIRSVLYNFPFSNKYSTFFKF
jgi:NADH:ubiquinone oxidoreductase subunit 6 (subunit J)